MLTTADFESAFRVYLDEMERCERSCCYWALLHLVVVIPDICAALEAANGEATKAGYVDWCKRTLPPAPPAPLTPDELYEMRCILLHQGSSPGKLGSGSSDPDRWPLRPVPRPSRPQPARRPLEPQAAPSLLDLRAVQVQNLVTRR